MQAELRHKLIEEYLQEVEFASLWFSVVLETTFAPGKIAKPAGIREKGRKEGVSEAAEQPNRRGKGRNRTRCGAREPSPRSPIGRLKPTSSS